MADTKQSSNKGMGGNDSSSNTAKINGGNSEKKKFKTNSESSSDKGEVLLKVGGLEYRAPGRRQRVVIASLVLGLNTLLVIAVVVYFYNPGFQDLIFNLGRN